MHDFQKFLNESHDKINMTPIEDVPEIEDYDINEEVRDLVIAARSASNLTQK